MGKTKTFTLVSGNEDSIYWNVQCLIESTGGFQNKGRMNILSNEDQKNYRKNHQEYYQNYKKNWEKNHKSERREYVRKYGKTEKGKGTHRKRKAKRRELGFIPLNKFFDGSEAHHIDKKHIIYIPEAIHKQFWHNLNKPETLKEINEIANFYIGKVDGNEFI